jgi:hypothetical protein
VLFFAGVAMVVSPSNKNYAKGAAALVPKGQVNNLKN